jgi:chemotaxis response regulator CheB
MRIEGEKQNTGRGGDALEPNAAATGSTGMTNRDILAIGTSAGGFEALHFLAGEFPPNLPASVLVVIHLSS